MCSDAGARPMKVQGTVNHLISGSFLTFTIDAKFEKMWGANLDAIVKSISWQKKKRIKLKYAAIKP